MIKIGIIEDEPEIRKLLRKIIERQDGFSVVSESGSFASAVSDFTKYRPDVAFIDIDLNGESGLECAKVLTELNPKLKVIFATAHSEYMANAFEIYAFDYLVKPFNVERVVKTLSRIRGEAATLISQESEAAVIQPDQHGGKLMIRGREQIFFIDKKEIIFIERSDNATRIVTKEETYKTSVSLGALEEKLNPTEFMRCHKSYIVNLSLISRIEPYGRWTYILKFRGTDETALMTAKNYEEIKKIFG
ncbi:MAG: LytR/AlgR family response regulator transcription factor [Lachnospiraceae bacterium]